MRLTELETSIRHLRILLSEQPSSDAAALGKALSILRPFRTDPAATAMDRVHVDRVERDFTQWFGGAWRSLASDRERARERVLEDIRALERPFRTRLRESAA